MTSGVPRLLSASAVILLAAAGCTPKGDGPRATRVEAPSPAPTTNGEHEVKVLFQETGAYGATVAPDGGRIVYRRGPVGRGGLYLREEGGDGGRENAKRGPTRLLATDEPNRVYTNARWSPDGTRLLLSVLAPRGAPGTAERQEVRGADDFDLLATLPAGGGDWSPDGKRIAVADSKSGTLILVTLDDGSKRELSPSPADSAPDFMPLPVYSPDGAWIALADSPGYREFALTLVSAADGTSRRLLEPAGAGVLLTPFWAPDGEKVAALVIETNRSAAAPDTSRVLAWDPADPSKKPDVLYTSEFIDPEQKPAFSPDGDRFALVRRTRYTAGTGGPTDLAVVSATGGPTVTLTEDGKIQGSPDWRDPGTILVQGGSRVLAVPVAVP